MNAKFTIKCYRTVATVLHFGYNRPVKECLFKVSPQMMDLGAKRRKGSGETASQCPTGAVTK